MLQKESLEYHARKAIEHASKGGIVLTIQKVFGAGGVAPMCSIYSEKGVELIREIKRRPKNMPFNVLVTSIGMANCIGVINDVARDLLERYANSNVSVVIENRTTPSWVTGGGDTVSVNIPMHEVVRKIIDSVGPMVFTSPNIHGQKGLTDSESVRKLFGHEGEIYYIPEELTRGDLKSIGDEFASTIVDTLTKPPKIIRQGVINIPLVQLKN